MAVLDMYDKTSKKAVIFCQITSKNTHTHTRAFPCRLPNKLYIVLLINTCLGLFLTRQIRWLKHVGCLDYKLYNTKLVQVTSTEGTGDKKKSMWVSVFLAC